MAKHPNVNRHSAPAKPSSSPLPLLPDTLEASALNVAAEKKERDKKDEWMAAGGQEKGGWEGQRE